MSFYLHARLLFSCRSPWPTRGIAFRQHVFFVSFLPLAVFFSRYVGRQFSFFIHWHRAGDIHGFVHHLKCCYCSRLCDYNLERDFFLFSFSLICFAFSSRFLIYAWLFWFIIACFATKFVLLIHLVYSARPILRTEQWKKNEVLATYNTLRVCEQERLANLIESISCGGAGQMPPSCFRYA